MKKLIPATVMLLVAAILMSTASFAWFSMNNKVTVTGMEIKTKVSSNLLIADGVNLANTTKAGEDAFTSTLTQTVKGILEPVSTVNGTSFFYTTDAKADGSKMKPVASEAYVAYSTAAATGSDASLFNDLFSQTYGVTKSDADAMYTGQVGAVPYVDYVFQLKAVNTAASDKDIKLTQLDLVYTQSSTETEDEKAYRVAVFADKFMTAPTAGAPAAGEGTLVGIYAPTGYNHFTDGKAVNSATTTAAVTYNNATKVATVASGKTEYYKVVVRLYLEGEDETCKNDTFMVLTGNWKLNITLELDTTNANVSALNVTTA